MTSLHAAQRPQVVFPAASIMRGLFVTMKKAMPRRTSIASGLAVGAWGFLVWLLAMAAQAVAETPTLSVVPLPKQVALQHDVFPLAASSRLVVSQPDLLPTARVVAREIERLAGMQLAVVRQPARPGDIELKIDPSLKNEAYAIDIGETAVVRAGHVAAAAQGTVTLLQAMRETPAGAEIPQMTVRDEPAVEYRGLSIDCARGWHSIGTLQQMVVLCRWYKIRYLQLHLTDDQSFTFPSPSLPQLAGKCQQYSLNDLRNLETFARDRGVAIIPEIDVPGHCEILVKAMPELFATNPPAGNVLCAGREQVYQTLDKVVGEMCDVFRSSPYFHIGADEVNAEPWGKCKECREYMRAHNLDDCEELYRHFIVRMNEIVKRHKKQTLVWEGFAKQGKTEIPRDITVMAFESKYNLPPDLLAGGYPVINAAWQPLYVVGGHRMWSPETIYGWNHYRWESCWDTSKAYKNPIVVPPTKQVLGASLCAWEQSESIELATLRERLAAMSERIWNPNAGCSFAEFAARLKATDASLSRLLK
jgi:hexosaminidase